MELQVKYLSITINYYTLIIHKLIDRIIIQVIKLLYQTQIR